MIDGMVDGDGVRLHHVHWPPAGRPEGPPLLMLHGTSSNALFWERTARYLSRHRRVALDLRGHGGSDRPESGYTVAVMAADCRAALDGLGLDRPVVVGHSWGLAVALELSSNWPELVSGTVLVDGPVASLQDCLGWQEADRQMRPPPAHYRSLAEADAAQAAFLGDAWGDDLRAFVRAGIVETDAGWVPVLPEHGRAEMIRDLYLFRPESLLPGVHGPVLVAMGSDPGDGVAPDALACWRGRAAQSARLNAQAELRIYDSRHDVPLIRPAELAADVARVADRAFTTT